MELFGGLDYSTESDEDRPSHEGCSAALPLAEEEFAPLPPPPRAAALRETASQSHTQTVVAVIHAVATCKALVAARDCSGIAALVSSVSSPAEAQALLPTMLRAASLGGSSALVNGAAAAVDALVTRAGGSAAATNCWNGATARDKPEEPVLVTFPFPGQFDVHLRYVDSIRRSGLLADIPEVLWPSSFVFSRYIARSDAGARLVRGARVLELGCGHGFVGIVAALCGASHACLTDADARALRLARGNVARNGLAASTGVDHSHAAAPRSSASVSALSWGEHCGATTGEWTAALQRDAAVGLARDRFNYVAAAGERHDPGGIGAPAEKQHGRGIAAHAGAYDEEQPCRVSWETAAPFDVILGSDVIYDKAHAPVLLACLAHLLATLSQGRDVVVDGSSEARGSTCSGAGRAGGVALILLPPGDIRPGVNEFTALLAADTRLVASKELLVYRPGDADYTTSRPIARPLWKEVELTYALWTIRLHEGPATEPPRPSPGHLSRG